MIATLLLSSCLVTINAFGQEYSGQRWATGYHLPMPTCRQSLSNIIMRDAPPGAKVVPADGISSFNRPPCQQCRRRTLISALTFAPALPLMGKPVLGVDACMEKEATPSAASLQVPNLDCLLDLPTLDLNRHVRLYLCRHGQTEYNKMGRIQGNQVPIDETGVLQAARLGAALARLSDPPETVFHSGITRSFQTANVATSIFKASMGTNVRRVCELPELARVNFGSELVGEPVSSFLTRRMATFEAWARGDIDRRLGVGGENAREVFQRIETALQIMVIEADHSPSRSCAAVSHSSLLRMLLAAIGNTPLMQVTTVEQKNGCVNVIDVSRSAMARLLDPMNRRFHGRRAQHVSDLSENNRVVQRVNEKRHLVGLG